MIPSCGEDHHLLYSWLTTFCFEDNSDKRGCTTHPLLSLKNSRHLRRKPIKNILSSFQALNTALRYSFVTPFPCSRFDWHDIFSWKPYLPPPQVHTCQRTSQPCPWMQQPHCIEITESKKKQATNKLIYNMIFWKYQALQILDYLPVHRVLFSWKDEPCLKKLKKSQLFSESSLIMIRVQMFSEF